MSGTWVRRASGWGMAQEDMWVGRGSEGNVAWAGGKLRADTLESAKAVFIC